ERAEVVPLALLATGIANGDTAPAVRQALEAAGEHVSADGVDDDVDASPLGEAPHLVHEVGRRVVDAVIDAEVVQARQLVVLRRGGEHDRTGPLRKLDGG